MTNLTEREKQIVAWLRNDAEFYWAVRGTLFARLNAAWLAFKRPLVQAFARHRLQSTAQAERDLQEARELLRDVAQEVRDLDGAGTLPSDLMARIDRLTQASDGGEG